MNIDGLYVQYGCGFSAPKNWLNFDASPTLRFERFPIVGQLYTRNTQRFPADVRYGNVLRGLPVPDKSCAGVFASHVLEHLALEEFQIALRETRRILAPGGRFRLIVPDLAVLAHRYVERINSNDSKASYNFMRESHLGQTRRDRGIKRVLFAIFGNSAHLWMWDEHSLRAALLEQGFISVRRAAFGDCDDPAFFLVEDADRFHDACAMEAISP